MVSRSQPVQGRVFQRVDHPDGPVVAPQRRPTQPDRVDHRRRTNRKASVTSHPAPSRPAAPRSTTLDHPMLNDKSNPSWSRWARNPDKIGPALERVLERPAGSLRGASREAITKALDEVHTRYGVGDEGRPTLRELFVARQRELSRGGPLGQNGLTDEQLDGKIGPITMAAEDRFAKRTGTPPGRNMVVPPPARPGPAEVRTDAAEREPVRQVSAPPLPVAEPERQVDEQVRPPVVPRPPVTVAPEQVAAPREEGTERRFTSDESREVVGLAGDHPERVAHRATELYTDSLHRSELLDSLGRDLKPEEMALLPEHVRTAIDERAPFRQLRDGLQGRNESVMVNRPTQADVNDTPAGRLAGQRLAALQSFETAWRATETDPAARQRLADIVNNEIDLGERALLGNPLASEIAAVATRRPPSVPGGPPERDLPFGVQPVPGRRAEQIRAHLETDTAQGRLDAQQLALRWDREAFVEQRRDELADELGRGLTPAQVARLPSALRHRVEARQLTRDVVDGLQLPDRRFGSTRQNVTPAMTESRDRATATLRNWLASADPQNGTHVRAARALYYRLQLEFEAHTILTRELFGRLEAFAKG